MVRKILRLNRGLLTCLGAAVLAIAISGVAIMQAQTQTQTFTCNGGFTEEVAPPVLMTSLLSVPNPVIPKDPVTGARLIREDLVDYVSNLDAAIRLGKTFFWEMQAGSDNKTACATCHFSAGADARTKNQLHPGANAQFDVAATANGELDAAAFPFTVLGVSDADDIAGSQGIRMSTFGGISKSGGEVTSAASDPVFNVGGTNVRQVTGRAAPAIYNAVFNHRNFWDGRAQAEFNGVNPFGNRDASARVWFVSPLGPTQIDIHIKNAGLASQALGPILSDVEMSAKNRTLPDVGKKLFALKPLGLQKVDASDSVLGPFADTTTGLRTTYKAMVQAAFKSKWWNTTKTISINRKSYTMMEANFGLFWGLSVMLYQATLVSDQTPMDRYLASRTAGAADPSLLDDVVARMQGMYPGITRENIVNGLRLFELPPPFEPAPNGAGCMLCHVGAETTSASNRNLNHGVEADDVAFANAGFDQRMERMFWQIPALTPGTDKITLDPMAWTVKEYNTVAGTGPTDVPLAIYDAGYYNIGVRPTTDDVGEDGVDPWFKPLSVVKWLQQTLADTSNYKIPGAGVNCGATLIRNATGYPLISGTLRKTERARVAGAFKVPALRNVELTAPYMHNGGKATLFQVVEFYDDGGDFKQNPDLAPLIKPLNLGPDDIRDLIAFMIALTDERVRWQRAPFDHPQLFVPNGDSAPGVDNLIQIPAVGAAGGSAVQPFLGLNPFN